MKYNILYVAVFSIAVAISFYFISEKDREQTVTHNYDASEKPVKKLLEVNKDSIAISDKRCAEKDPIFTGVKAAKFDEGVVNEQLGEAFSNPASLIEKAAHDPIANITLFRMASSCFEKNLKAKYHKGENGCPASLEKLPVRATFLELLQNASDQGSDQAKLMYALSAPMTADYFRDADTQEGRLLAQEIMTRAKELGESAARAGIPDALRYMSRVYETGLFGQKDIQLAYVYALPLRSIGSKEDLVRIEKIGARINDDMKKSAEIAAFGCGGQKKNLDTNIPF